MDLNATTHCGCDSHGHCVGYNSSRYETSEATFHESWNKYEVLKEAQVCQCDPGWTGYGDFGVFQHEALMNCATNISLIKVMWGLSISGFILTGIRAIQFSLKVFRNRQKKGSSKLFFVRPMVRVIGAASGLYLSLFKSFSSDTAWKLALSHSYFNISMVALLNGCEWYETLESDLRQLNRFLDGALREFGLVSNSEQYRIKHIGIILKCYLLTCALTLGTFGASSQEELWSLSYSVIMSQAVIASLVNVLYIKPRAFKRLLDLLNSMVSKRESVKLENDCNALTAARGELKERLLAIRKVVSMQYRVAKYQLVLILVTHIPFTIQRHWKYMGYLAIFWGLGSLTNAILIIISMLRGRHKKKKVSSSTKRVVQPSSVSSVSAFHTTYSSNDKKKSLKLKRSIDVSGKRQGGQLKENGRTIASKVN